MVILGCDIGGKDHCHFYEILNLNKFKLSSELSQKTSKLIIQTGSNKNYMMEPLQPRFLCCFLNMELIQYYHIFLEQLCILFVMYACIPILL